jgi:hypothetical protein
MASKNYAASEVMRKLVEGRTSGIGEIIKSVLHDDYESFLFRVVVTDVIFDPSLLDEKRLETISTLIAPNPDTFLKNLPLNSIIGKRVISGKAEDTSRTEIFFPFLPNHFALPCKPGEHVWCIYPEPGQVGRQGYWLWPIAELRSVADLNYTHADRKFSTTAKQSLVDKSDGKAKKDLDFSNGVDSGSASLMGSENEYEKLIIESDAGKTTTFEPVPRYRKRPDETIIQGSNNSLIRLGTDRVSKTAEKEVKEDGGHIKGKPTADVPNGSGTVEVVVGRNPGNTIKNSLFQEVDKSLDKEQFEGNSDFENDAGRIYLSANTKADDNFKIEVKNLKGKSKSPAPAAIIKTDQIRFVAREDIKIMVQPKGAKPEDCCSIVLKANGDIVLTPSEKGVLKLGGDDATAALLAMDNAINTEGKVTAPPMISTMGGSVGLSNPTQGFYASKILVKVK